MNYFLKKNFNIGKNCLGVGEDFKEDYAPYIIGHEKKTADAQKYGCKFNRWFVNMPCAKPSKTPKYKLYSQAILPDLENDKWDVTKFNQAYFDGIFADLLLVDKAYGMVSIIDITGFSRVQVLFPKQKLYAPENYWFLRALTKKCIQESKKYVDQTLITKIWKVIFQGFNEPGACFKGQKTDPESKRIIGRAHWIIWDEMRKNGLKISNLKVNLGNGLNMKGEYINIRTRDMVLAYIGEYVDWETGKTLDLMKKAKLKIAPRNQWGYKQNSTGYKMVRDMILAWHGWSSVLSLTKKWLRTLKSGKTYWERITSSFHCAIEPNTCGDADGFNMTHPIYGKIGLWKSDLFKAGVDTWKYNLGRPKTVGVLNLSHPRGDGKSRIYSYLEGHEKEQSYVLYHDEFWSAEDYIKPLYDAYLSLGFAPIKQIKYKGIMEEKYKNIPEPLPDPEPIIIHEESEEERIIEIEKEENVKTNWLKNTLEKIGVWFKKLYEKSQPLAILVGFGIFAGIVILLALIFTAIF